MSNISTFNSLSKLPLGSIIKMGDTPSDGEFLPTGSVVSRASYPEFNTAFPHPKAMSPGVGAWIQRTSTTLTAPAVWSSIAYANGVFVAVGGMNSSGIGDLSYTSMWSTNGISWTSAPTMVDNLGWNQVAVGTIGGSPRILAIAYSSLTTRVNYCIPSTSGISWNASVLPVSAQWAGVGAGPDIFLVYASGTTIYRSTNLGSWTAQTLPVGFAELYLAYGNGVFVGVGFNQQYAIRSTDGITWTSTYITQGFYRNICFGNGIFITYASGSVMTSTDGISWTYNSKTTGTGINQITYGDGRFVFLNINQATTDGISWTSLASKLVGADNAIAYGNNTYVAVGGSNLCISAGLGDPALAKLGTAQTGKYVKVKY